ncbi:unnamed protein product, partial [Schistosoma mattheei]|uniref:Secreted protein n=2 Tax=Schistosoma TaxID=6181 RepID=A0A183KGQ0_9TREM
LVSSLSRWTVTIRSSFSSNSFSKNAFLSIAWFRRDSKSSNVTTVALLERSKSSFNCSSSRIYLCIFSRSNFDFSNASFSTVSFSHNTTSSELRFSNCSN